nr:hypothetical protein [Rhodococcus pyridinivorans]
MGLLNLVVGAVRPLVPVVCSWRVPPKVVEAVVRGVPVVVAPDHPVGAGAGKGFQDESVDFAVEHPHGFASFLDRSLDVFVGLALTRQSNAQFGGGFRGRQLDRSVVPLGAAVGDGLDLSRNRPSQAVDPVDTTNPPEVGHLISALEADNGTPFLVCSRLHFRHPERIT